MYNQFAVHPEVLSFPECTLYIQVKTLRANLALLPLLARLC